VESLQFLFTDQPDSEHEHFVTRIERELAGKADGWAWDTQRPGLGVRVRRGKTTSMRWHYAFTFAGEPVRMPIGLVGNLTLDDARAIVNRAQRDLDEAGVDPRTKRADIKARALVAHRSFSKVVEEFLGHLRDRMAKDTLRQQTYRAHERYLTGGYFADFHDMELTRITRRMVHDRLTALKNVGVEGGKPSANVASQARGSLMALYIYANQTGDVESYNPVMNTINYAPRKEAVPRDRVLTDGELIAVWNVAGDDDYGRIIRLAILLGNRISEIAGMKWSELKGGVWHLPAKRHKNHHGRKIPLPAQALAIINQVERNGRDHVFGRSDKGFTGRSFYANRLRERLQGKVEGFVIHDFRRTMRTGLGQFGDVAADIRERMIGHIRPKIERVYDQHEYMDEQAHGFRRWADHVMRLVRLGNVTQIAA
jgi:integrase